MRKALRIASTIGGTLALSIGIFLVWLTAVGTPAASPNLRFVGFVPLPKLGTLSVLDYMSVYGDQLYIAGMSGGTVIALPLGSGALPTDAEESVMRGKPATHGIVLDPVSHLAFVTRSGANVVDVFNPASMQVLKSIPVAQDPDGIVFDPESRLVYVATGDGQQGVLIDPAQQATVGSIAFGGKLEAAAVDPVKHLLYQNVESTDEIASVDLAKRTVVARQRLDSCQGPSGMAIDIEGRRLFVACGRSSTMLVLDLKSMRVIATLPLGKGPDVLAFDPGLHRVYSAGVAGVTTVVQQDSPDMYHVASHLRTHFGAHTLTVDPATHRVYIGYAGLFVQPRVAVFEAVH